jgi:hypothetical protein
MNSNFTYILIYLSLIGFVYCNESYAENDWIVLYNYLQNSKETYFRENVKFVEKIVNSSNISAECNQSILNVMNALTNLEDWSHLMYNSWGKFPPSGIFKGTVTDFGDYDQCLAIEPNEVIKESQYCLIDISLPLPKPMPIHQNFFHKINVLPEFVNKSKNNVLVKLSEDASFFYWIFIRQGICTPNKCSESDIKFLTRKSE